MNNITTAADWVCWSLDNEPDKWERKCEGFIRHSNTGVHLWTLWPISSVELYDDALKSIRTFTFTERFRIATRLRRCEKRRDNSIPSEIAAYMETRNHE